MKTSVSKAVSGKHMDRDRLIFLITQWHKEDKHAKIIEAIEELPSSERDYKLTCMLARAYLKVSNVEEDDFKEYIERAFEILKSVEIEGLTDYIWHYRMAEALYWLDRETDARIHLEQSLAMKPDNSQALGLLNACDQIIEEVCVILPVTLERIEKAFQSRDLKYDYDQEGAFIVTNFDGNTFVFSLAADELQLWATWGPDATLDLRPELLEAANKWNLEAKRPRTQVRVNDDGTVWACTEWFVYCGRGMTENQFQTELSRFINTSQEFFSELDELFPLLSHAFEEE